MAGEGVVLQPIPGVELRISGDSAALHHFSAEYAAAQIAPASRVASLDLRFIHGLHDMTQDRHKTVAWRSRLARPDRTTLTLEIDLRGIPRWFGLSLVQGYLVEPVLSLLAAETGQVLLPAAGIGTADGLTVLIGQSRTGKSSLSLRALAAGIPILGDDQLVITPKGEAVRFPRRLRVYDDLSATAPAAVRRLPASSRRALRLRRLIRVASRGAIAPSLAVPAEAFDVGLPTSATIARVVLLQRDDEAGHEPKLQPASVEDAARAAAEALTAQRLRLRSAIGSAWDQTLADAAIAEQAVLLRAFAGREIAMLTIPGNLRAGTAVPAVARLLDLP